MNSYIEMRDKIRKFIAKHGLLMQRIAHAVLAFISFRGISTYFGYSEPLMQMWIILALSAICAFVPMSALALIIAIYMLIDLAALSTQVFLITAAIWFVSYVICKTYQSKQYYHIVGLPIFYQFHLTPVLPMEAGLLGGYSESIPLVCGIVSAFFLRSVRDNAAALADDSASVSAIDLLKSGVLANQLFYVYLIALVVMFVVISLIHSLAIRHAWILSGVFGVLCEFVIMLGGYLLLDNRDRIPTLIWSNIATLIIGLITTYLIQDLDYNRTERVQFEDDDYYYYVTAVPKISVADEKKQVRKITHRKPRKEQ